MREIWLLLCALIKSFVWQSNSKVEDWNNPKIFFFSYFSGYSGSPFESISPNPLSVSCFQSKGSLTASYSEHCPQSLPPYTGRYVIFFKYLINVKRKMIFLTFLENLNCINFYLVHSTKASYESWFIFKPLKKNCLHI